MPLSNNNSNKLVLLLVPILVVQGIISVSLINQNIYFDNQTKLRLEQKNNYILTQSKLKTTRDMELNNSLNIYQNSKEWQQYTNNSKIKLEDYRNTVNNQSPLMEIKKR